MELAPRRDRPEGARRIGAFGLLLAVGAMVGCGNETAPEDLARVQVLLTDASPDTTAAPVPDTSSLAAVDSAWVWISHVYLLPGAGDPAPDTVDVGEPEVPAGHVDLYHDEAAPILLDLLRLDGVTADLTGEVPVDERTYTSLRFVIDSARVVLAPGYSFDSGATAATLPVPDARRGGFKVRIRQVLAPDEGELVAVTVAVEPREILSLTLDEARRLVLSLSFRPVLREQGRTGS